MGVIYLLTLKVVNKVLLFLIRVVVAVEADLCDSSLIETKSSDTFLIHGDSLYSIVSEPPMLILEGSTASSCSIANKSPLPTAMPITPQSKPSQQGI